MPPVHCIAMQTVDLVSVPENSLLAGGTQSTLVCMLLRTKALEEPIVYMGRR